MQRGILKNMSLCYFLQLRSHLTTYRPYVILNLEGVVYMGNYFSNLHVKKGAISSSDIKAKVFEYMSEKGYAEADSGSADFEVALYAPADSAWISVYCDDFEYTDVLALSSHISKGNDTDVLSIACFDSDYLFLNLLNAAKGSDLWLNVGSSCEIKKPRRSNPLAWKDSVVDFKSFHKATKQKYVFAEDFLSAVQNNLNIPFSQSLGKDLAGPIETLYFSAPQKKQSDPTALEIKFFSLRPCEPGQRAACIVNNNGAASRGVRFVFIGVYIENDEITIDDAEFTYYDAHGERVNVPIVFEKCQLSDGTWGYGWEDKEFKIPPAVSSNLAPRARAEKESQRSFGIRYTPNGNKRKFLDLCVFAMPLSNPQEGSCYWRVWAHYPSKLEYVEDMNASAREMTQLYGAPLMLIDPKDYDLD